MHRPEVAFELSASRFVTEWELKKHMRNAHGERLHIYDIGGLWFNEHATCKTILTHTPDTIATQARDISGRYKVP